MKLLVACLVLTSTLLNSGCMAEKRVLALLENLAVKETHSAFFRLLTDQGFTLTFKAGLLGIRDILVRIGILTSEKWIRIPGSVSLIDGSESKDPYL
jgi:hypothetical protein